MITFPYRVVKQPMTKANKLEDFPSQDATFLTHFLSYWSCMYSYWSISSFMILSVEIIIFLLF